MRRYYYCYRSTAGNLVPGVFRGLLCNLKAMFQGSQTPLVEVTELCGGKVEEDVRQYLESWLRVAPLSETGLRHSLRCCLGFLKACPK